VRRALALAWLLLVAIAAGDLLLGARTGWRISSDLLALLPQDARDPVLNRTKLDQSSQLARRVILLAGHEDRASARAMAEALGAALVSSGLATAMDVPKAREMQAELVAAYLPYRQGLLSEGDRQRLGDGRGEEIVRRAVGQVFGFVGVGDGATLRDDPFLLMPAFFADLPFPRSRLSVDEGMPTVARAGKTWALISLRLAGEPYALDTQERVVGVVDTVWADMAQRYPGAELRRLGPVFFAAAASTEAMRETSIIGAASIAGTVALVLIFFRALAPLWQTLLAMGVGVAVAFAACQRLFGEVHVGALLFGTSLIGTTVDYSLHYFCEAFAERDGGPAARLRRVLPALSIALTTTLVGYAALLLAPLPGLHQIAVFSGIGLIAAFATVVLWLPVFGWRPRETATLPMVAAAAWLFTFWEAPRYRVARAALLSILAALALAGAMKLSVNDDIRRMQALSPALIAEQAAVQDLTGIRHTLQYFLVRAPDAETALQREERLAGRLRALRQEGALGGFATVADFVPSAARQRENARLVAERLEKPFLESHRARLGLPATAEAGGAIRPMTPADVAGKVPLLSELIVADRGGQAVHITRLEGPIVPDRVGAAAQGIDGVTFVDPTADINALLAQYRERAIGLVAVAALLMVPIFLLRYGMRRGSIVILPPLAAVALTPMLLAVGGEAFSFFNAMALILVLAMGVDYAVFCAEASLHRRPATMLAVTLATATTLMSFGFLAYSSVPAVHAFGATMMVGIALAFVLSPLAAGARGMRDT
jgi:predicted exporter